MSANSILKYRPDIDGLRTIAVVIVVIFHAYPKLFPSGFIGVDIFFVISGFLISSIVMRELEENSFSIKGFYFKRARRILPALSLVLASTLVVGFFSLPASELRALAKHVVAGVLFVSNIVLYKEAGYFDTASEGKPLLHLWSLGIEEQFYIFWPLILLWCFRKKNLPATLLLLLGSSFIFSVFSPYIVSNKFAFFMLPSRFWELLTGGALAVYFAKYGNRLKSVVMRESASFIAVALLLLGCFLIGSETPFPSYWALIPVVSAALFILAEGSVINRYILAARPMVFVGRVSYPWYLWHWPFLVLGKIFNISPWLLVIVSLLLSIVTFYLVEKPIQSNFKVFRLDNPKRKGIVYGFSCILAVCILASFLLIKNVIPSFEQYRYPDLAKLNEYAQYNLTETRIGKCFMDSTLPYRAFDKECYGEDGTRKIALLGDSHAAHLFQGLAAKKREGFSLVQLNASGCPPFYGFEKGLDPTCVKINEAVKEYITKGKFAEVIIFANWYNRSLDIPEWESELQKTIHFLKSKNIKRIVLVGPFPIYDHPLPEIVANDYIKKSLPWPKRVLGNRVTKVLDIDKKIKALAVGNGVEMLSLADNLCDGSGCLATIEDNSIQRLVSYDAGHLTKYAAKYIVDKNENILFGRVQ